MVSLFGGEDGSSAVETASSVKACRSLAAGEALPRYCHGRPTVQRRLFRRQRESRAHNPLEDVRLVPAAFPKPRLV